MSSPSFAAYRSFVAQVFTPSTRACITPAARKFKRVLVTLMMLAMLFNQAIASPLLFQAWITAGLEWRQQLAFHWSRNNWPTLAALPSFTQSPKGWDGKGSPAPPSLAPQPQETEAQRLARVAQVKISNTEAVLAAGSLNVFQAIAFDAAGNPVSGVIPQWRGEDASSRAPLPVVKQLAGRAEAVDAVGDAPAVLSERGEFKGLKQGSYVLTATVAGRQASLKVDVFGEAPKPDAKVEIGPTVSSGDVPGERKISRFTPLPNASDASDIATLKSNGGKAAESRQLRYASTGSSVSASALFQGPPGDPNGWNGGNYTTADDPGEERGNVAGHAPAGTGTTNHQFTVPLVNLDGRGIDTQFSLTHNARLWHKSSNDITFDIDRDWPAPGWNLGFGKLMNMGNSEITTGANAGYMLVEPDGTRHPYRGTSSIPTYQPTYNLGWPCLICDPNQILSNSFSGYTTDGSLINYDVVWQYRNPNYGCPYSNNHPACLPSYTYQPAPYATVKLANGTNIVYGAAPWTMQGASRIYNHALYPILITDANGNSLTISYVGDQGPRINAITDTVGRV